MSAENIIINFTGDASGLQPAESALYDILKAEGLINKETEEVIANVQKMNKAMADDGVKKRANDIANLAKLTKDLDKSLVGGYYKKQLEDIKVGLQITGKELKGFYEEVIKNNRQKLMDGGTNAELEEFASLINVAQSELVKLGGESQETTKNVSSLKAQLRAMVNDLGNLEEGTTEFKKLSEEAGQLKDRITDLNSTVSNLGSDTKNIDGLIGLASGVAGGFAVAQGAAALFGEENEDMQKALVKLNAAMSILQGLQELQNLLQKESAAMLLLNNVRTKALAAGQTFLSATTMGSVAATYALRTALIASGIGAMVVIVGALAGAFDSMGDNAAEAAEKIKKSNDDAKESLESYRDVASKNEIRINRDVDIIKGNELIKTLELQGGSIEAIAKKKKEVLALEIQTLNVDLAGIEIAKKRASDKTLFVQEELKTAGEIYTKKQELARLDISLNKDLAEDSKKRKDKAKADNDKAKADRQKEIADIYKSLTDQADAEVAQRKITILKNKTDSLKSINDLKNAEISAIVAKKNESLKQEGLTKGEIAKIEKEAQLAVLERKKQYQLEILNIEKSGIEALLTLSAKGSQDEYDNKLKLIDAVQKIELQETQLTQKQIDLIKNKAIIESELALKERRLAQLQSDKDLLDIEVQNAVEGSNAELQIKLKNIDLATKTEIQNIDERVAATEEGQRKIAEINNRNKNEKIKIQLEVDLKKIDVDKQITDALSNSIIAGNNRIIESVNATYKQRKKAEEDIFAIQNDILQKEKNIIEEKIKAEESAAQKIKGIIELTADEKLAIEQKYQTEIISIEEKAEKLKYDREQKELKKKADLISQFKEKAKNILQEGISITLDTSAVKTALTELTNLADSVFKTLNDKSLSQAEKNSIITTNVIAAGQQIINQLFADSAVARQKELENIITQLEEEKQRELDNKNLSEQQKADIEERYKQKERAARLRAWEAEKEAKKEQAVINGALAITNILATVPKFDFGVMTAILIGAAIATTAVQVNAINKSKPPKFKDGVIDLKGPGTTTSDSIDAKLSRGESVIKASSTAKWKDALSAINENKFEPWLFNKFKDFVFPTVPNGLRENSTIDYDKLAEAVALKMAGIIPAPAQVHNNIDGEGLKHFIINGKSKTEVKNKYFTML